MTGKLMVIGNIVLTVALFASGFVHAQEESTSIMAASGVNNVDKTNQFGVGAQVGNFSGVNAEYWVDAHHAVGAALTFENGNTALNANYVWKLRGLFSGVAEDLVPFIGGGLIGVFGSKGDYFRKVHGENFAMAVQVPIGIEYLPRTQRFGIFGEISPGLQVTPASIGVLTGDIGARFYF